MSNIALNRLQRECKEVVTNSEISETGIMIEILNENLTEIRVITNNVLELFKQLNFSRATSADHQTPRTPVECSTWTSRFRTNTRSRRRT